jgi:hypothetical protein
MSKPECELSSELFEIGFGGVLFDQLRLTFLNGQTAAFRTAGQVFRAC